MRKLLFLFFVCVICVSTSEGRPRRRVSEPKIEVEDPSIILKERQQKRQEGKELLKKILQEQVVKERFKRGFRFRSSGKKKTKKDKSLELEDSDQPLDLDGDLSTGHEEKEPVEDKSYELEDSDQPLDMEGDPSTGHREEKPKKDKSYGLEDSDQPLDLEGDPSTGHREEKSKKDESYGLEDSDQPLDLESDLSTGHGEKKPIKDKKYRSEDSDQPLDFGGDLFIDVEKAERNSEEQQESLRNIFEVDEEPGGLFTDLENAERNRKEQQNALRNIFEVDDEREDPEVRTKILMRILALQSDVRENAKKAAKDLLKLIRKSNRMSTEEFLTEVALFRERASERIEDCRRSSANNIDKSEAVDDPEDKQSLEEEEAKLLDQDPEAVRLHNKMLELLAEERALDQDAEINMDSDIDIKTTEDLSTDPEEVNLNEMKMDELERERDIISTTSAPIDDESESSATALESSPNSPVCQCEASTTTYIMTD